MKVLKGAIQPRSFDKMFNDSPDTGHPDCICSRCGNKRIKKLKPKNS